MKYLSQPHRFLRHLPTLPFIYFAAVFIILLDVWVELYHRICFPFYSIPYIKRRHYIKIDRHKLKYLKLHQKFNCGYCGYANGVVAYWTKIFAETERYWCGSQHQQKESFHAPEHHTEFTPFNDREAFAEKYDSIKKPMF